MWKHKSQKKLDVIPNLTNQDAPIASRYDKFETKTVRSWTHPVIRYGTYKLINCSLVCCLHRVGRWRFKINILAELLGYDLRRYGDIWFVCWWWCFGLLWVAWNNGKQACVIEIWLWSLIDVHAIATCGICFCFSVENPCIFWTWSRTLYKLKSVSVITRLDMLDLCLFVYLFVL